MPRLLVESAKRQLSRELREAVHPVGVVAGRAGHVLGDVQRLAEVRLEVERVDASRGRVRDGSTSASSAAWKTVASSPRFVEHAYWWRSTYPRPPWSAARWKTTSIPLTAVRRHPVAQVAADESTSPRFHLAHRCSAMAPLEKSSTILTWHPVRAAHPTSVDPMNEAPPVTSTAFDDQLSVTDVPPLVSLPTVALAAHEPRSDDAGRVRGCLHAYRTPSNRAMDRKRPGRVSLVPDTIVSCGFLPRRRPIAADPILPLDYASSPPGF